MGLKEIFLTALFFTSALIRAEENPAPFITKCRSSDAACISKSTQAVIPTFVNGLPQFKIEKLDPVVFPFIDASSPQLKFLIHNLNAKGIRDCVVNKVSRDLKKSQINADLKCNFVLDGQYEMEGNILLLKIQGKGDAHGEINDIQLKLDADLEEYVGRDGEKYWRLTGYNYSYKALGKSKLQFDNLFEGNKVLGDAVRQLFDTNANAVIEEIGGPILNIFIKDTILQNVNKFFKHVPSKYLSID